MSVFRRFSRSPFEPLAQLLQGVDACVEHLRPMVEANLAADFFQVKVHFRSITKAEHDVDELKNSIRDSLPASIFLPVDRSRPVCEIAGKWSL